MQQLVSQLVYIMFITNNHASFHLWRNLVKHQKLSKYYDYDCSFKVISQRDQFIPLLSFNVYFHVNISPLCMSHLFHTIQNIIVCIVGKDDENEMVFVLYGSNKDTSFQKFIILKVLKCFLLSFIFENYLVYHWI